MNRSNQHVQSASYEQDKPPAAVQGTKKKAPWSAKWPHSRDPQSYSDLGSSTSGVCLKESIFGTPLIFGYPSSPKQILPGLFSVFPAPFLEALDSSNEAVGLPAPWGASAPVSSIVQGHLAADSAVDANDMTEADPLIETHTTVVE